MNAPEDSAVGIPIPSPDDRPRLKLVASEFMGRPRQRHIAFEPLPVVGDEPEILPTQPAPYITQVAHLRAGDRVVTAITRRWRPGEARRCRLCPAGTCTEYKGICTVLVNVPVAPGEGKFFSSVGLEWRGPGVPFRVIDDDGTGCAGGPIGHRQTAVKPLPKGIRVVGGKVNLDTPPEENRNSALPVVDRHNITDPEIPSPQANPPLP